MTQRGKIADILGEEAEEIVYLYSACDRDYFWPQFTSTCNPEFKNRFTGQLYFLKNWQLEEFCELTVANELEITDGSPKFIDMYGKNLYAVFEGMGRYLSGEAILSAWVIWGN